MYKKFENEIFSYTKGVAKIDVFFPEDVVQCQYCVFCRSDNDLKRYWCRLNNEMIYDPFTRIGDKCPIEFEVTK